MRHRIRQIAAWIGIALLAIITHGMYRQQAQEQAFQAVFGTNIPTSQLERKYVGPVVREKLAQLKAKSDTYLNLTDTSLPTLTAANAATSSYLQAHALAEEQRLTTEAQIDEALDHVGRTIQSAEATIRSWTSPRPTGMEILKKYRKL